MHTWAARRSTLPRLMALGLGLGAGLACQADGATLANAGAGAVPACQTCHGAAGEGLAQAGFPRLAALGAPYLQRQLAAFANGTRANSVMMPIAQALSAADRAAVSAYYAALPAPVSAAAAAVTTAPARPAGTGAPAAGPAAAQRAASAAGRAPVPPSAQVAATLATRGRWADQLPACDQCHGPGGRGVGPDFPPLAGQSAGYLANQLTAWQSGTRPPGPLGLMGVVARKLSAAEVLALAEHYASLPTRAAP